MLTGPWATTEWANCNNSGGLNLGGHPERHDHLLVGTNAFTFSAFEPISCEN